VKKILVLSYLLHVAYAGECIVSIDIGHTLQQGGATSAHGVPEYRFNYIVAKQLNHTLRKEYGIKTYLINPSGENITLKGRLLENKENHAHLMVSIHHDSVKEKFLKTWTVKNKTCKYCDTFSGYSIFVSPKNKFFKKSLDVSSLVGESLIKQGFVPTLYHKLKIKGESKKMYDEKRGIYRYDNLVVLKGETPSFLIEGGMIVNREEELSISDPKRKKSFVRGISEGISSWCKKEGHFSKFNINPNKDKVKTKAIKRNMKIVKKELNFLDLID